mgnify:CR=1 FL=1
MNNIKNIKDFRFWCQPIIPLVYENELSYYEVLCRVKEKLNEVIKTVNTIYDSIIGDVNAIVDGLEERVDLKIEELENKMNQQLEQNRQDILALIAQMELQLKEQQDKINQQLEQQDIKIDNKILQLEQDVETQIALLKAWVNGNNTSILAYIDSEIQKVIDMIPTITSTQVINPITGKMEDVGTTIYMLSNLFRIFAEPAGNWDNRNYLTAGQFDELGITAWEWDIFGWDAVGSAGKRSWKEPVMSMRSPFNGEWDYYKDVINDLFEMHRTDAFTSAEWDNEEMVANYIDENMPNGHVFDWQGYLYFKERWNENND